MIYELNLTYDPKDALDYYENLEKNYARLKWDHTRDHNDPAVIDKKNYLNGVYGWGLQTIFNDLDFPYHNDIDPHDEGPESFKNTVLVHGFVERLFSKFKQPYRSFLMSFPPKRYIGPWLPSGPRHVKIILPIVSNSEFAFKIEATGEIKTNIVPGRVLMLDFTEKIAQYNNGDTDIIGIVFNVPYEYREEILNLNEKI